MRQILLLVPVFLATLFACSTDAWAHGGGRFRGPGGMGPPRPRTLRCDCAELDCAFCGSPDLAGLRRVSTREARTKTRARWGDLVEVETRVRFETRRTGFVEGHAVVRHAPLFAAVAGRVEIGDAVLEARRKPSTAARRDYLWARRRSIDPLLVTRAGADAVKLRVYPIHRREPTFAVVRGYALSDDVPRDKRVRAYRTATRYLVVVPLGKVPKDAKPDLIDPGGDRALFFLEAAEARARYAAAARRARKVPCVDALSSAVHDDGTHAVTRYAALIAVPKGEGAPKDLVVGEQGPPVPPPPPGAATRPPSARERNDRR